MSNFLISIVGSFLQKLAALAAAFFAGKATAEKNHVEEELKDAKKDLAIGAEPPKHGSDLIDSL